MSTPITLKEIYESATGLLKRFDLMPSPRKAYLKMQEEIFELQEALAKLATHRKNIVYQQDAADELADVMVTLLNVGYANGLSLETIEKSLQRVIDKNDQKTERTHTASDGWIKRITPVAFIEDGQ